MRSSVWQIKSVCRILFSYETSEISRSYCGSFICIFLGILDFGLQNIELWLMEGCCIDYGNLWNGHLVYRNSYWFSLRTSNKLLGWVITVRRASIHAKDFTCNFIFYLVNEKSVATFTEQSSGRWKLLNYHNSDLFTFVLLHSMN